MPSETTATVGLHGEQVGLLRHVVDSGTHAGDAGSVGRGRGRRWLRSGTLGWISPCRRDVAQEGLVGDGVGGDTGQELMASRTSRRCSESRMSQVRSMAMFTVGVGHVEAFNLRSGGGDRVDDRRDRGDLSSTSMCGMRRCTTAKCACLSFQGRLARWPGCLSCSS